MFILNNHELSGICTCCLIVLTFCLPFFYTSTSYLGMFQSLECTFEQDLSLLCIYQHRPSSQSGKSGWCYWSSHSFPPQFWPPGKKCETRSSPQTGASRGSLALSEAARSGFQPHTLSGRWCEWVSWSFYSDNTRVRQDCRSCDLSGARTSVSSMPAGQRQTTHHKVPLDLRPNTIPTLLFISLINHEQSWE